MAEAVPSEHLISLGTRIETLIWQVKTLRDKSPILNDATLWASFEHEYERWRLWAENLGLFHLGHGSLDYRLRDADSLTGFVRDLFQDLSRVLDNCESTISYVMLAKNA